MATMPTRRVNEPTQSPVYKSVLIAMMSYRDGIEYSKSYEFSPEELGEVTPEDVYKWMAMKVYGHPDPNNDDNPTHGWSSSLEYYKKALSYFMPNRLSTWNAIMHSGNPTRSVPVNNLIKAVKKKEVRRQGKPSQATRRPLKSQEFSNTMHILHSFKDSIHRYQLPALCAFQFHMVGRIDDCVQLTKINLTANLRFPFTLMAKLCWTKTLKKRGRHQTRYSLHPCRKTIAFSLPWLFILRQNVWNKAHHPKIHGCFRYKPTIHQMQKERPIQFCVMMYGK